MALKYQKKPHGLPTESEFWAIRMRAAGWSWRAIADGSTDRLTYTAIRLRLKKFGIATKEEAVDFLQGYGGESGPAPQRDNDLYAAVQRILNHEAIDLIAADYSPELMDKARVQAKDYAQAQKQAADAQARKPPPGLSWPDIQTLMQDYHRMVRDAGKGKYPEFEDFMSEIVEVFNRQVAERYPQAEEHLAPAD